MKSYEKAVTEVLELLKKRGVCSYSVKSHKNSYQELEKYLSENSLDYSLEVARSWLKNKIGPFQSSSGFVAKWHYIDQLEEYLRTGTIVQDHLLLNVSNYEKLSEYWRNELDMFLESQKAECTSRTISLSRTRCSRFLLYLQERHKTSLDEITINDVCDFYELEMPVSVDEHYVILSQARLFLWFQVQRGICKPAFPLILEETIYKYSADKSLINDSSFKEWYADTKTQFICNAEKVYESIDSFQQKFETNGYKNTSRSSSVHVIKCLYVFLVVCQIGYSPEIGRKWFGLIKNSIGSSCHTWSRMLILFENYIQDKTFELDGKYTYKQSRTDIYPEWCTSAVDGYIGWLRRTFHSENTVRTYKYSVYDFCDYILKDGVKDFLSLTRNDIIKYLEQDCHKTAKGTATRRTILRQFITYLEESKAVSDKSLHGVFPDKVAGTVHLVTILSERQIETVQQFRRKSSTPIELRDAAMVMTGLRLGFRTSDVINLRFSDIDWKSRTVTIEQYKTKASILLPLCTDVGNAIYRYIKYGRPRCSNEMIFIRHRAPYGKLSGKICSNALNRILNEPCGNIKFHSLRKTFATNILKNNAGVERVIDALGHQDPTTVNVYLSYDEEHMRKCPISLKDFGIEMGGGF